MEIFGFWVMEMLELGHLKIVEIGINSKLLCDTYYLVK